MNRLLLSLLALTAVMSCLPEPDGPQEHTVTELQQGCVVPGAVFTVQFATCLSSSCDSVVDSTCEITVNGSSVVLSGEAVISSKTKGACTADCGFVDAQCSLPAELAPGTYTLEVNGNTVDFDVPVAEQTCVEL